MCVPEEHAHEATMQHRDILIEMEPESSLPDYQMPTPVAAPRVPVMNGTKGPVFTPNVSNATGSADKASETLLSKRDCAPIA